MELKPFNTLPIFEYFRHDLEKILMAHRLSGSIRKDLKNIRASGDEVELAVKDFFARKLFPKYHVCDGHIVDKNLKVSPQYDIVISENEKNPVLFNLSDKSELVYFESTYCFAEVKSSFYKSDLIESFSNNIARTKNELVRDDISPAYIETSGSGFYVEKPLTKLPFRNPLFTFMTFVDSSQCDAHKIGNYLNKEDNRNLPNFICFLDLGIVFNVNKQLFEEEKVKINLYPEFETEDNIWVLFQMEGEHNTLTYQYMLVLEHLNSTVVSPVKNREYTKNMFDFSFSNFHKL